MELSRSFCASLLRSPHLGPIFPGSSCCNQLPAKVQHSGKASFTTPCFVFHPGGERETNVGTLAGHRSRTARNAASQRGLRRLSTRAPPATASSGRARPPEPLRRPDGPPALPAEPRLPVSPVFANSVARRSGTRRNTPEMRPHGANTTTACLQGTDACAAATATPAEDGVPRRTARPRGQNSASSTERTYQSLGSGNYRTWRLRKHCC